MSGVSRLRSRDAKLTLRRMMAQCDPKLWDVGEPGAIWVVMMWRGGVPRLVRAVTSQ